MGKGKPQQAKPTLRELRLEIAGQYGIAGSNWATAEEKAEARAKIEALAKQASALKGQEG